MRKMDRDASHDLEYTLNVAHNTLDSVHVFFPRVMHDPRKAHAYGSAYGALELALSFGLVPTKVGDGIHAVTTQFLGYYYFNCLIN